MADPIDEYEHPGIDPFTQTPDLRTAIEMFVRHVQSVRCDHDPEHVGVHTSCLELLTLRAALALS